jgi:hypothetical protein
MVYNEILLGDYNGNNKTFYLKNNPVLNTELLFYNGQLLYKEKGDYSINGKQIIINSLYETNSVDRLCATYMTKN